MSSRRIPRPSAAMVVALVALVSSLAGNAVAAGVLIRSSAQIGKGAVNSGDVRDRTLTERDIKRGSLTGVSVKNGSLAVGELSTAAQAALRGQTGPGGPQGERGPEGSQGAAGANGTNGTDATVNGVAAGGALNGTYPNPLLAGNAVGNSAMADNAVGNAEMADNAVGNAEMADNAVGNTEMADNAIGNTEMADNAVTATEVSNGTLKLADIGVASTLNLSTTLGITLNAGTCTSTATGLAGVLTGDLVMSVQRPTSTAGLFSPPVRATTNGQFPLTMCNFTAAGIVSPHTDVDVFVLRP